MNFHQIFIDIATSPTSFETRYTNFFILSGKNDVVAALTVFKWWPSKKKWLRDKKRFSGGTLPPSLMGV